MYYSVVLAAFLGWISSLCGRGGIGARVLKPQELTRAHRSDACRGLSPRFCLSGLLCLRLSEPDSHEQKHTATGFVTKPAALAQNKRLG